MGTRSRWHRSELHIEAGPVVAANHIEILGIGIGVQRVVGIQHRRLLVEHVVDADADPRVDRLDAVADRQVVVDVGAVMQDDTGDTRDCRRLLAGIVRADLERAADARAP